MSHACANSSLNAQETDFVQELAPMSPEERKYDEWFRAKVQEGLDSPPENDVPHEQVMAEMQAIINSYKS